MGELAPPSPLYLVSAKWAHRDHCIQEIKEEATMITLENKTNKLSVRKLDVAAVDALTAQFSGTLIDPQHAEYDQARRVWNGMIDRYPALIARCHTNQDVAAAIACARTHELPLAVRGGGHSVAGHATVDDGLVIDLSPMHQVEVDPERRIACVGGGATWGQVDAATQLHGLVTPGGVFADTGVAGLTLGGGYGYIRNKFGLSCDNLVAAEVVTADGTLIRADANEHIDLLWALRGGGGNFGVVTAFEYQLHPLGPDVAFTFVLHDASTDEQMAALLRFFRNYCTTAPDEVSLLAATGIVPPEPEVFPVELHGRAFVLFGGMYAGPAEEGERVMQPVIDVAEALMNAGGIMPYVEAQKAFDHDYPDGRRYYWKSINVQHLDDAVIDILVDHSRRQPSPFSTTDIWHVGPGIRRFGAEHAAFRGREASYLINPEANWLDAADDAANIAWVRDGLARLEPYGDGSRYLNFAGMQEEGDALMQQTFGERYARLAEIKRRYDPHNVFRLNQNIKPIP
jgi:FAD/FMN-containing dehydrogenase